jgi:AcrR family transcriptional regulator
MPQNQAQTPLTLALTTKDVRATPLDAFKLARKRWLRGERLNLNDIADEIGINRATLFRWVGTKELLLAEIIWSVYQPTLEQAMAHAKTHVGDGGPEYIAEVCRYTMNAVLKSRPLQKFVQEDPQFALRILTSTRLLQERRLEAFRTLLDDQVQKGHLAPALEIESLALLIIRMSESFAYSELIVGREPAIDEACKAIYILAGGSAPFPWADGKGKAGE